MSNKHFDLIIKQALREDTKPQDITTISLVSSKHNSHARIFTKEPCIVCGLTIVKSVFKMLDKNVKVSSKYKDGASVKKGSVLLTLKGQTRGLLTAERVALNFLGRLSGIATLTHSYVKAANRPGTQILDTRKTTPNLRIMEKYAVQCGGGTNHRFNLSDMVMIKDNHREVCQPNISITQSIQMVRNKTNKKIVIEVDTLEQLTEALLAKPDVILLDNMKVDTMKQAIRLRDRLNKKILLEASGGITLKNIKSIAQTGVNRISVGALTHSPQAIDVSMEIL